MFFFFKRHIIRKHFLIIDSKYQIMSIGFVLRSILLCCVNSVVSFVAFATDDDHKRFCS